MKINPVSHGKHNNIHFNVKVNKIIGFKLVGFPNSSSAFVVTYSIPNNTTHNIVNYLDPKKLYDQMNKIMAEKYDMNIITPYTDILIKRNKTIMKPFLDKLYREFDENYIEDINNINHTVDSSSDNDDDVDNSLDNNNIYHIYHDNDNINKILNSL